MRFLRDIKNSIFGTTLVRLIIFSMITLTICRAVWFGANHFWIKTDGPFDLLKAFLIGTYFDLPVLAMFFLPVWLWLLAFPHISNQKKKWTKALFSFCTTPVLILTAIDTGYSQVTARRSGTELFSMLGDEGNRLMPYLTDYWWALLLLVLSVFLVYLLAPVSGKPVLIFKNGRNRILSFILALFAGGLWLLTARGGLRIKPLNSLDAAEFVSPSLSNLASSTPLQLISTFGQNGSRNYHFMPQLDAEKQVLPFTNSKTGVARKNLVVIIVESLGRDYTGFLNGKPFTPFLDSLAAKSLNFPYCFANGVKSMDMVPSVFCGIPALSDEHFILTTHASNNIENAFAAFAKKGYSTGFFHGAKNGTMRFQQFLAQTGLQHYFGLNEYPKNLRNADFDGNWGIFDMPYLKYALKCMDTFGTPFFTSIFTLSSHHPYSIPKAYAGKLPHGSLPIHETIAYTDASLREFFTTAATKPWYNETVFVITADHTSYSEDAYFYSETGHYEIPLLIYTPGMKSKMVDKTVSQCDIIPTVSEFMGLKTDFFGLGRSAFDSSYSGYSLHRENRINFIVQYPYTLGMTDEGKVTDYYSRLRNETSVQHLPRTGEQFNNMLTYLKASLQVYSQRQMNNKWQW